MANGIYGYDGDCSVNTTKISLAKALKLKNRLSGRLSQVQNDIVEFNSVLKEQVGKVNVAELMALRDEIAESLIGLKTAIVMGNIKIQEQLIRLGEIKAKLAWMQMIPDRDGQERHGYQNTEVTWVATIKKADIDAERKKMEAQIDSIQDSIDGYNHTCLVEIPQRSLDLGS